MEFTPKREQHARSYEPPAEGGGFRVTGGIEHPPGRWPDSLPGRPISRRCPLGRRTGELADRRTGVDGRRARKGRATATAGRSSGLFLAVLVALLVLSSAACGDAERGDAAAADTKQGQGTDLRGGTTAAGSEGGDRGKAARADDTRSGDAGSGTGETGARLGEARADAGSVAIAGSTTKGPGGGDARGETPRKVALEITGERGARFSGACTVGGKERTLDGRVPERYVFEPRGKRLECGLRNEGGDALGVVLSDGAGARSQQRISGGETALRLVYSNGSVSSSTLSSVSRSQTVTSSGGSVPDGSR